MNEAAVVLLAIRDELEKQCPHVAGRLAFSDEALSILDGKAMLTAIVHNDPDAHPALAHCHVVTDISDRRGVLDACTVGIHADRREALADAGRTWVETVAAPILSLLHARPVMEAAHFDGSERWGVSGCHGFVGPMRARLFDKAFDLTVFGDAGIFDYAAEMAPPGLLHLAKATLQATGDGVWSRTLDVDGHLASHKDRLWSTGVAGPSQGVASVFAVFHYGDQSAFMKARQETDEAIRRFVSAFQTTDDPNKAADLLSDQGTNADLVHQIVAFAPLAFGRVVFESLVASFAPDFVRIRRDGSIEEGLKLMRQPVFARSMALSREFMERALLGAFKKVALTSPEVRAINQALVAGSKPGDLRMGPSIIPVPDASAGVIEQAMRELQNRAKHSCTRTKNTKPWWQFW